MQQKKKKKGTEWSVSVSGKDDVLFVKLPPKSRRARLINTCFQLGDFLIKEKAHGSSRRRCYRIRKLLNQRSRRTALRGASFIFI